MKATTPEKSFIIRSMSSNALVDPSNNSTTTRIRRRSIRPSRSISVLKSIKPLNPNNKFVDNSSNTNN